MSINYSNDVDPIWVVINTYGNRFGGVVAQGKDWCTMKAIFQKVRGRCILFTSTELDSVKRIYKETIAEAIGIVKTGSSQLGPDEGGMCNSIGLSAACPSKLATIRSMVVVVIA